MAKPIGNVFKGIGQLFGVGGDKGGPAPMQKEIPPAPPPVAVEPVVMTAETPKVIREAVETDVARTTDLAKTRRARKAGGETVQTKRASLLALRKQSD